MSPRMGAGRRCGHRVGQMDRHAVIPVTLDTPQYYYKIIRRMNLINKKSSANINMIIFHYIFRQNTFVILKRDIRTGSNRRCNIHGFHQQSRLVFSTDHGETTVPK